MERPRWIHLTARVSPSVPDLSRAAVGGWLWAHLRDAFPDAIAAVLMSNHPHLLVASNDSERDRVRLARMLGQLGRHFGVRGQISEVPPPSIVEPGKALARTVRYIALNPCRKDLVRCPLAWPWSTHRDVVGAIADPWVDAPRLARALGSAWPGFVARHHAYVSADPDAHVLGTMMPVAAAPSVVPKIDLRSIAEAAASALRRPVGEIQQVGAARRLLVALAIDQGWNSVATLAEMCRCSTRTIHRLVAERDVSGLPAARLCLGDPRLRRLPSRDVLGPQTAKKAS